MVEERPRKHRASKPATNKHIADQLSASIRELENHLKTKLERNPIGVLLREEYNVQFALTRLIKLRRELEG